MKKIIVIMVMLGLAALIGIPQAATADYAYAEESAMGDIHDDRPDDADSVGGDSSTATTSISAEARAWADAGGFDLTAFEGYTAPAAHTPTSDDIAAFENWMSGGSNPRNQVMKQIQGAAGEAIANELWNYCNTIWKGWMNKANVGSVVSKASGQKNVAAMQEGMFAGYFGAALGSGGNGDGYGDAATLVKNGFVVSSDGATYRLHNMVDGTVAYEMAAPESATVSEDE
ncbi:MAG: hypothetical protein LBG50_03250, partial [Clostridiales Family XIII bacterium]|nr:hypothetical protein [Clostridiales Family XIII bacterium]